MSEDKKEQNNKLNKDAKEYVPTKKRVPNKLNFNLDAKEYKPKVNVGGDDDEDEGVKETMDIIVKDMAEDEVLEELGNDDSEDEDKCIQKYKDCKCCHGYIYKCKGEVCSSLGQCYCKMQDDCENP